VLELPQFDAAENARGVVDEFDAMAEIDRELLCVAAADLSRRLRSS
jgi:hypothetical protein